MIDFIVTGDGDPVQGVVFNVQVADAYPDGGGIIDGPNIQDIDLVASGTVFGDAPFGNYGNEFPTKFEQIWLGGTSVKEDTDPATTITVAADGLLAILTVDTTGFFPGDGPWELNLYDTLNGTVNFQSPSGHIIPTITDGWIKIAGGPVIPEPTSLVLLLLGGLTLLWW